MRLKSIALLALTLQFPIALANPSELSSADFRPDSWSKGLHLTAAIGLSESVFFESKSPREHLGEGAVLKTELAYYLSEKLALELGSFVSFTRVDSELFIWNTNFTLGVRRRSGSFLSLFDGVPYYRVYAGWGPVVAIFRTPQDGADRIHLRGPAYGAAFGQAYETKGKIPFFVELGLVAHYFHRYDGVKEAGLLPQTLFKRKVTTGTHTLSLSLSLGILAF